MHVKPTGPFSGDISKDPVCDTGDVAKWTRVWRKTMMEGNPNPNLRTLTLNPYPLTLALAPNL